MTPHRIGQDPTDANGVLIDHERRIGTIESKIEILSLQVQTSINGMEELKGIVIQGNKDSMEFFKQIIGHEHGMEKSKNEFKQHMQQMELDIKQKQLDAEEALKKDREEWERKQKEQQREMFTATMKKVVFFVAPVITAVVTYVNYLIQNLMGGAA